MCVCVCVCVTECSCLLINCRLFLTILAIYYQSINLVDRASASCSISCRVIPMTQ